MKKILNITFLVMGCLFWASCGDDDYTEKINSVQVTEGQTEIPAAGASKTLSVTGEGIKAESAAEWLDVEVAGNTITVTAGANYSRESRHTTVDVTAENGDFLKINISQLGAVFVTDAPVNVLYTDEAATKTYSFDTNLDVQITTSAGWLSAELKDGELSISATENTTGQIRGGYVYYTAGTLSDRIAVTQGSMADLIGSYMLVFTELEEDGTETQSYFLSTLTANGSTYSLNIPSLGWQIPVTVDASTLSIAIAGGSYIGDYSVYKCHTVLADSNEGYITWNTSCTYEAAFRYAEDEDGGYALGIFADNGSWDGYNVDELLIYACTATPITSSNRVGYLVDMINPYLVGLGNASNAPMRLHGKYGVETMKNIEPKACNKKVGL